jgi:hypothetical protein
MAAGRKRKFGHREPNGQLKRPSRGERESFAKRLEEAEMQTVLAQPHRRGNRDQRCETALGRFFIAYPRLRDELFDAAKEYAGLKGRWRAAKGAPSNLISGGAAAHSGPGPSDRKVRAWGAQIAAIEQAVASASPLGLGPMQWLVVEDRETPPHQHFAVVAALRSVAVATGRLCERDHPWC